MHSSRRSEPRQFKSNCWFLDILYFLLQTEGEHRLGASTGSPARLRTGICERRWTVVLESNARDYGRVVGATTPAGRQSGSVPEVGLCRRFSRGRDIVPGDVRRIKCLRPRLPLWAARLWRALLARPRPAWPWPVGTYQSSARQRGSARRLSGWLHPLR